MLMKRDKDNFGFVIIPKNASTSLYNYFCDNGFDEIIGNEQEFSKDFTVYAVLQDPVKKFAKGFAEVYMRSMTNHSNDPVDIREQINQCVADMKDHLLENFFYRLLKNNNLWKETHLKLQCRQLELYQCNKHFIPIEHISTLPKLMDINQPIPQRHQSCKFQQRINLTIEKIINDSKYTSTLNNLWQFIFPDVEFYNKYFPSTAYDIKSIEQYHSIKEKK